MLANGSPLSTVDALPIEDAKHLYVTLISGLWGPYGQAHQAYSHYCSLHANKEVAIAVATGKKYKPTQPKKFHEMFPHVDEHLTLGLGKLQRKLVKEESIAHKMAAMMSIEDAPNWIKEATNKN